MAINGLGQIDRATLKVLLDTASVQVAAVNDLVPIDDLAYLLRYDSVYGRYPRPVSVDGDALVVDGHRITVSAQRPPAELPRRERGVDLVFECTGAFRHEPELAERLTAGARFVILSAPARTESAATVVHGTNRAGANQRIISCASCTTNCITPVVEILGRRVSVARAGAVTTRPTTAAEVNDTFHAEATTDRYRDNVGVAEDPIVSTDIVGDSRASVIDVAMTRVVDGTLVKIMSWYDNEWGFTHQMVPEALAVPGIVEGSR